MTLWFEDEAEKRQRLALVQADKENDDTINGDAEPK